MLDAVSSTILRSSKMTVDYGNDVDGWIFLPTICYQPDIVSTHFQLSCLKIGEESFAICVNHSSSPQSRKTVEHHKLHQ